MATLNTALSVIFVGQGLSLDGSTLSATETDAVNLSGSLVSMSGALVTQIQSAAGVLSLNGATGLLTVSGPTTFNNYVGVSTAGTTVSVTGAPFPTLSGIILAGGARISGSGPDLWVQTSGTGNVLVPNGKVGFGAPVPAERVHVSGGNLRVDGNIQLAAGTTSGAGIAFGDVAVYRNAAASLTILANMVIGPAGQQAIMDGATLYSTSNTSTIAIYGDGSATAGVVVYGPGNAKSSTFEMRAGSGVAVTIPANRNVGIGIAAPAEKLHVSGGNARFDSGVMMLNILGQAPATFAQGGQTFVSGGALYYRGSGGTISLLAPA